MSALKLVSESGLNDHYILYTHFPAFCRRCLNHLQDGPRGEVIGKEGGFQLGLG